MEQKRFPVFSERFTDLRGEQTQAEFADYLGISRPTVGFYENGTRIPDALVLRQIAERCNVSADWLLGLSDTRTTDVDIRQVCVYTGLSEQAVEHLHHYKNQYPAYIDSMNFLLESDNFEKVLYHIYEYSDSLRRLNALHDFRRQQIESLETIQDYTPNLPLLEEMSSRQDRVDLSEYKLSTQFGFVIQEIKRKI